MVNLTRIYTRAGDDGTTRLVDNSKVAKTDPRLRAYADVDEANASIGVAVALGGLDEETRQVLQAIQNDLFDVGADLGNPMSPQTDIPPLRITDEYVERVEQWCDRYNERVEPLRSFVLPGGTAGAALLHQARTVTRRAERTAWEAYEEHTATMNLVALTYLNRLSDLLFILARVANLGSTGDVLWSPGEKRRTST